MITDKLTKYISLALLGFFYAGGGKMVVIRNKKIERGQKNMMREKLEDFLAAQKDLDQLISLYEEGTPNEEYRQFWQEIKEKNLENMKRVSRFMVTKCNR